MTFQASRVLDYEASGPAQSFEELAKAAKGRWDNVKADEFVRELRSEDGE